MDIKEKKERPFLKWVGGKGALLPELLKRVPENFTDYYEPFLGGGALFFALNPKHESYLNDINKTLIGGFHNIKLNLNELVDELREMEVKYLELDEESRKEYYYTQRTKFNTLKSTPESIERTATLIFLNKTCFNGMYRENSKGDFNVPAGRYKNPRILDESNLSSISKRISDKVIFTSLSFENAVKSAKENDFVYLDPPYYPVSKTSSFTSYSEHSFLEKEQILLRDTFKMLSEKGVYVMLSNSYTPFIIDIYKDFYIDSIQAPRFINSKSDKRGKVLEVVVTNYATKK